MLTSLRLRNYRCFDDHELPFRDLSVLVGKNNAGKSTVAEALRLVSLVTARHDRLPFKDPPSTLKLPLRNTGISPSLEGIEIEYETLFHRYGEPPARVTAAFDTGCSVDLYLGQDVLHAVLYGPDGRIVKNKEAARRLDLDRVSILPQIGPLEREERLLTREYVLRAIDSRISHRHFRNQVFIFKARFEDLRRLVEETWPGLSIVALDKQGSYSSGYRLALRVRDRDFVAEVGAMGHGLQMWLQTMWFLTRSRDSGVVILDEPDVYLHADLQRRLIRFIRGRFPQVLLTTHSVEILSDVEPENVLIVDRDRSRSEFATSVPAVQTILSRIGTVHNLGLSRLWKANKLLLVEGKDVGILKRLHRTLFPTAPTPFDVMPCVSIGGWSGWPYAIGSSLLLKNSAGDEIRIFCILDSDYHTDEEIQGRLSEAAKRGIRLHIWHRKELENYLLSPNCIARIISQRRPAGTVIPSPDLVHDAIASMAETMREQTFDRMAQEQYNQHKAYGTAAANAEARRVLDKREKNVGLSGVVSGKELISQLSAWSQSSYGVSLNAAVIAADLHESEMPNEIKEVIRAIETAAEAI